MDFAFDPFDSCRLVVGGFANIATFMFFIFFCCVLLAACEDAKLKLWTIPSEGLRDTLTNPQFLIGIML